MESKNNNGQEEWVFIEDKQVSSMGAKLEEVVETEFKSDESSCDKLENVDFESTEDFCPISETEWNDDISDPGFYDQLLPDIDVLPVKCYRHCRNKQLNFYLDLLLALAVATAVGLGTGHFLGWSNKCLEQGGMASHLPTSDFPHKSFKREAKRETLMFLPKNLHENPKHDDTNKIVSYTDDLRYSSLMPQREWMIRFYKNSIPSEFISDSKINESIETDNILNQKSLTSTKSVEEFEALQDTYSNHSERQVKPVINEDNKVEKLIQKLHSNMMEDKYSGAGETRQLKADLSNVIQSIQELVSNETQDSKPGQIELENNHKVVTDIYEKFQMHVNQKVTELEKFESSPFDGKLVKRKSKVVRKMTNSLIQSVDSLLQLSVKFIKGEKPGSIRTKKLVKKGLTIIENLERKWNENRKMACENKHTKEAHFKKQDSKQAHFKKQDLKEAYFKNEDTNEVHSQKQDTKECHFKKQNEKEAHLKQQETSNVQFRKKNSKEAKKQDLKGTHSKKQDAKAPHFEKQDLKEVKLRKYNAKEPHFRKQDKKEANFMKQNKQEDHFKNQDTKEAHFRKQDLKKANFKKEAQFKKQNGKEAYHVKQDTRESHFKK